VPSPASPTSRTAFWYVKFVLACYAAGFAAALLLLLILMPFVRLRDALFERHFGVELFGAALLVSAILLSPLVWRYLR